jgi:hypothetical protein
MEVILPKFMQQQFFAKKNKIAALNVQNSGANVLKSFC